MSQTDLSTSSIGEILNKLREYYTLVFNIYETLSVQETARKTVPLIKDFIDLRQGRLIPYLEQLSEKANNGHNCATCSGKCSIEHSSYLMDLQASHFAMEDVLQQLSSPGHQTELKRLLTAAVLIESTYLVPAISNAQKAINVYG